VVQLVVGNKKDLESERQVSTQEGQEYADNLGFKFLETSAKESINVDQAFKTMTMEIKRRAKVIDNADSSTNSGGTGGSQQPPEKKRRTLTNQRRVGDGKGKKKKAGCC
jgi:GTPase SAR1 family protein